ncbi:MAG: cation-translocating P-type ATPase [Sphingomonadales bacterium]|nr:cation-translocating P-type ATPase [Sphingomonadales bacterium]
MPEQKLRIVEALKSKGEIVAMTGDGVNDAPSVKAAHIGIAMGGRGTDVAREASSIVLLDDDFGSIVKTARLGRRIYDNMRKAMGYVLAMHVPIAGLALLPLLFGWPLVLTPVHIAFLEMVIDPVCSIVFEAEPEEEDIMLRPPRDPASPLLSSALVCWYLLQGVLVLAVIITLYGLALARAVPEEEARALAFVALVSTNVGLIFVNRSHSASIWTALSRPNPWLWMVLGAVAALLAATLFWPPLTRLFRFGPLHLHDLGLALAAGATVVLVLDLMKPLWARRLRT